MPPGWTLPVHKVAICGALQAEPDPALPRRLDDQLCPSSQGDRRPVLASPFPWAESERLLESG
jgi:hypothetical protein